MPCDPTHSRRAYGPSARKTPANLKPRSALSRTNPAQPCPAPAAVGVCLGRGWVGVCRVCRGCVGWVCHGSVSRACGGCVGGVSAGCVAGACRVWRGRVLLGCVRGLARVCAAGWKQCAPGAAIPPPPLPRARAFLRVSSTRVVRRGFLFFSACGRPRGLPLFRVFSAVPHPSGVDRRVPRDSRCRPFGTSSSFFPGDANTRKTDARLAFDVRAARRFYSPSPHRSARNSNLHPPRKKHPPAPRGPTTRPGMDVGRPPKWLRTREVAVRSGTACLSGGFPRPSRLHGAKAAPASAVHAAAYKSQVRVGRATRATAASACVNCVVADAGLLGI